MGVHSFHLAHLPLHRAAGALLKAPSAPGLRRIEVLGGMELGSPVFSVRRMQMQRMSVFAEWDDEAALDDFLKQHPFGQKLGEGWHVRLIFLRRWGSVREFAHLPEVAGRSERDEPVVAVTLARMRLFQLPRFIRWGRPVERQVRDHPEATLALAATPRRWPNVTARTFTASSRRCAFGHFPSTVPGRASLTTFLGRWEQAAAPRVGGCLTTQQQIQRPLRFPSIFPSSGGLGPPSSCTAKPT